MKGKKKKTKVKMGRPPIPNPKNRLIALRVTAKEREMLIRKAKKAGMTLSEYILSPHRDTKG